MALKEDRYEESTDISHFSSTTGVRGQVVCLDAGAVTNAAGAAMDQGENTVSPQAAASSDIPVGILLNDIVNKDLTRTHLNQYKDEVQLGGKVTVLTRGWVVTDQIDGEPAAGNVAYASNDAGKGLIGIVASDAEGSGNLAIGRFMSKKDSDGYAKVYVNLPNHGQV